MKTHRVYRFGLFSLDAQAKVLLRDREPVRLPRKAVETLLALVERSGEVLTREELMESVWPNRVVDDANLAQNIAMVRKALAVPHGAPGWIETFPGRGYWILGPISAADDHTEGKSAARLRITVLAGAATVAAAGILLVAWLSIRHDHRVSETTDEPHPVPVTRFVGMEYQAAVSPDGKAVAFVWEREGEQNTGIWVQDVGGASARAITSPVGNFASPAWSPDGRRLAYVRFQGSTGSILVKSLDSGAERLIASLFPTRYGLRYHHLDWSPDGRTLVIDVALAARQALGIFLVSLESGEKRRLTRPDDLIIGDLAPRFSPDGRTVSFIRAFHRAGQDLHAVPVGGGAEVRLTADGKQITGQDWMPDGKALVFSSNRSGEFRLWKLGYPPGKNTLLRQTGLYSDFPLQVSLARRSSALVYSVINYDLNIWRLDLTARSDAPNRWFRAVASSGQDVSPQYSPRGDKISFRSDRSGDEQLWVSDSDGGNALQITRGVLHPSVGRWSPDGRSIVFNNALTRDIFVARLVTNGGWNIVPLRATGIHPVFSPDGRWIYAGTDEAIVRYPAQGGAPSEVARVRGISLDVSADGRYVYFVRNPSGTQLWRVETATGRPQEVLDALVPYCSSCWALAPNGIYYLSAEATVQGAQGLRFHDFARGRNTKLLDYPEPLTPLGSGPFSLSPDARYLLCVRVDHSSADVFRVDPFH